MIGAIERKDNGWDVVVYELAEGTFAPPPAPDASLIATVVLTVPHPRS